MGKVLKLTIFTFLGLSRFLSQFWHQMGPKEGEILILEKNDEEQSCLFYWDLSDALSLVKIGPQIKKLVFLFFWDLVVIGQFLHQGGQKRVKYWF